MRNKFWTILLSAETLLCIILALAIQQENSVSDYLIIAQFPFAQIGQILRSLSLSGTFGNVLAFIFYIALCSLPVAYGILRLIKKTSGIEDALLIILSGFSFYMMYCMINPSFISIPAQFTGSEMGKDVLGGVFYSIFAGYTVMRLLRKTEQVKTERLLRVLRLLLGVAAAAVVMIVCYAGIIDVKAQFAAAQAGNTDPSVSLEATYIIFLIRYILVKLLPGVLNTVLFLMAMRFCELLADDKYGDETVKAAEKIALFCSKIVITVMLCWIFINLLQLVFSAAIVSANYNTILPLGDIVLAFAMLLIARFFAGSQKLKRDNEMFI
jgi:hypothetical protein